MKVETTTEFLASLTTSPDAWLIKSIHLFDSAEMIFDKSTKLYRDTYSRYLANLESDSIEDATNYLQIGLLLAGYGFETLMKYEYIRKNIDDVRNKILSASKLPGEIISNNHNLIEISKKIRYLPPPYLENFLKKLSVHSLWAGRYPVPKSSRKFDDSISSLIWFEGDVDKYYELRDDIFSFLNLDYDLLKNLKKGLSV
jgi:hypothetical protein